MEGSVTKKNEKNCERMEGSVIEKKEKNDERNEKERKVGD